MFEIKNGYASSNIENIYPEKKKGLIEYKRPSNKLENTTAGYIEKNQIPNRYVFPKETLFVSTDGQGSHTFSYVSPNSFVPNSNISVLIPTIEMTLIQKVYYAQCITANRYKFSYGRKPKGKRLADILLPSPNEIPSWVYEVEIPDYSNVTKPYLDEPTPALNVEEWKEFRLDELFEIEIGRSIDLNKLEQSNIGINYVGRTEENNGVTAIVKRPDEKYVYSGNCITVPMVGNAMKGTYQENEFCCSQNISILRLKGDTLNVFVAIFLITLLKQEMYRYSYGRPLSLGRMKESAIKLPSTLDGNPDWEWMEKFIKGCGFSRCL